MKFVSYTDRNGVQNVVFKCPGCTEHIIPVARPTEGLGATGPTWGWNGDKDSPTLTPSILTRHGDGGAEICHSFVLAGQIQFLSDCTHELAGQTVPLPDVSDEFRACWEMDGTSPPK